MNWRELGVVRSRLQVAPRHAFAVVLVLAFLSLACWSFADPLVAAPDEQAHILRADALVHGQFGSPTTPPSKVSVMVTLPTSMVYSAVYPICWQQKQDVPATCSAPWPTNEAPVPVSIYVAHYPPLYYLLVGSATYVSQQRGVIYLMRLISCALSALMLALSAYAIARWSRRRTLYAALLVVLTPQVTFLASSVNPSGFEITTAVCLWTLVTIWGFEHREDPPRALITLLAVVAGVLVLIRGLSPLWLALAAVTLIVLVGPRASYDLVRRRHDIQRAGVAVAGAGVLAALWIFTQGTLNILPVGYAVPRGSSTFATVRLVASFIQGWLRECVGILGWLDTELPGFVYRSWYTIVIGLLVIALWRGNWRDRLLVAGLAVLVPLLPFLLVLRQAKVLGVVWQGRDILPLAVGAAIVAMSVAGAPPVTRARRAAARVTALTRQRVATSCLVGVIGVVSLANLLAFYTNLRRYAVGRYGPTFFFLHAQGWSPPTGQFLTLALYGLVTAGFGGVIVVWVWLSRGDADASSSRARIG